MNEIDKKSFKYKYSKSEKIFNSDFLKLIGLTITVPTIICFGISNYMSYSQTLNDLKTRHTSQILKEIDSQDYTAVKSLDSLINTIGVKPGFNLAVIKYNSK